MSLYRKAMLSKCWWTNQTKDTYYSVTQPKNPKHDSPLLVSSEVTPLMQPSTLPKICMERESCIFWPVVLGSGPIDKNWNNYVNTKPLGFKNYGAICSAELTMRNSQHLEVAYQWWINRVPGRSQEWQIMLRCQNSWVLYFPNRIYNRTCLHPLACCITQEFSISQESSPK